MDEGLTFTVLGARGSWPVSDPDMLAHGGRTTSFMIPLGGNATVLIDAGTGVAKVDDLDAADLVLAGRVVPRHGRLDGFSVLRLRVYDVRASGRGAVE